jgi:hypothetical protein
MLIRHQHRLRPLEHTKPYISAPPHTSAYVSIRQHTLAYVSIRQHTLTVTSTASDPSSTQKPTYLGEVRCQYLYFSTIKASKLSSKCLSVTSTTSDPTSTPNLIFWRRKQTHRQCQYLYFYTSKASKLSTCGLSTPHRGGAAWSKASELILVKQAN